ncbi:Glutaminase kidney isoform, mitochondrial [Bagarius yarrelli]|uniref:glutaminase n=1 Tax=Bagarius yarrelli TaxID=175774 RepID=A0A556U7Y0_BAGYA|nr:Glutaminase kidney isoform, mitochondrial [Bagarius yarrelli]
MLCLKHLGAISAGVSLFRQTRKLANGNGHLFRTSLIRLMRTSTTLAQNPRHQHVILDIETEMDSKIAGSGLEDLLFYTVTKGEEKISVGRFISELESTGLLTSDPRLRDCMHQLHHAVHESAGTAMMDQELFRKHSIGDTMEPFCLQSCVKPLEYALAVHDFGTEHVHTYVGKEPSGVKFNKLSLNEDEKPHNPMVNAGAIVISSLLKIMDYMKRMAGGEYVGFSNATFQSEKETGDRNFAIGYYLKEKKCFPNSLDMVSALDFYFQLCSIEVTCESGSVMAATLANGGICPITGERVLSAEAVRNTLSLMHSCGMNDFSGQFAFHVGLPAKSGVSGAVLLVVPNVMGVMCWSPPIDRELVSLFNFHNYDNLRHFAKKLDPRRQSGHERNKAVIELMFAAYSGDVSALKRFALSAVDMDLRDYDSRSALHLASAEGHLEAVKFLTGTCRVNPHVKDRWGNTPLDDAIEFGQDSVAEVLKEYQSIYSHTLMPEQISTNTHGETALDAEVLGNMEALERFV